MLIEEQRILDNVFPKKIVAEKSEELLESTDNYRYYASMSLGDINNNSESAEKIPKICYKRRRSDDTKSGDETVEKTARVDSACSVTTCKKCDENCKNHPEVNAKTQLDNEKQTDVRVKQAKITQDQKKGNSDGKSTGVIWSKWIPSFLQEPEYILTSLKNKGFIHRHADSLFSTDSGFTNYRGLLNLCILLLALSNTRLFIENLIKYGILIDPVKVIQYFLREPYSWPNALLLFCENFYVLFTFGVEVLLSKEVLSERLGLVLNVMNLLLSLVVPATVILFVHPNPVFSVVSCGVATVVFLKLVSYVCVNKWCREKRSESKRLHRRKSVSMSEGSNMKNMMNGDVVTDFVSYPDNLTLKDVYYFICTPTLCYELNFPRTIRIRKRFLVKRAIEMMFLAQLMTGLVQQWIIPTVNNSLKPLTDMEIPLVIERLLKLAVPNHLIWLIFFYWFFHSCLNVTAELLRFGDREFYKDWWNAESISEFWQTWNVPVHRWALRHLYKPLLRRGVSKQVASVAVFATSAFFHEYLLSVPLRMFRVWAFTAMLMQVPLAMFTAKVCKGRHQVGNMIVWLSLILGQPIAILAYVHDYYIGNVLLALRD